MEWEGGSEMTTEERLKEIEEWLARVEEKVFGVSYPAAKEALARFEQAFNELLKRDEERGMNSHDAADYLRANVEWLNLLEKCVGG